MLGDRRQGDRIPCRIGAVMCDETGERLQLHVTNLSEEGAFVPTKEPIRPGSKVRLSFEHPTSGRQVDVEARVARRVLARPGRDDKPGNGLYFEQPLSRFRDERRGAERRACDIRSELHVGAHEVAGHLADISEGGALLVTRERMQIGAVIRLAFSHPGTCAQVETWGVVVRGPRAAEDGQRGYGVCFDESLSELASGGSWERNEKTGMLSPRLAPQGHELSFVSDADLVREQMTRKVRVAGTLHRLVLAGSTELLVECGSLPGKGQWMAIELIRPGGSALADIQIYGRVRRAGATAVEGWKPGFTLQIDGFGHPRMAEDYRAFVRWLGTRSKAH